MTKLQKALLLALFGALYLLPLFLTVAGRIHPTTTMVHEQLSINYLSYDFMKLGYFFTETGQFSILLLAYPASIISHLFVGGPDNYARMQIFIDAYYFIHALLLGLVAAWIVHRGRLGLVATIGLLSIPLVVPAVEQVTNLGLMINYNKATDLVLLILGYWITSSVAEPREFRWSAWAGAGCLVGFATGTKLSLGLITAIFAAGVLCGSRPRHWAHCLGRMLAAAAATAVTLIIGLWIFHRFNTGYLLRFLAESADLYRSGFIGQHTPFLGMELQRLLSPASYYFAWQLLLLAYAVSWVIFAVFRSRTRKISKGYTLLAAQLIVFLFLWFQLTKRFTQGTMIDITGALGMALIVNIVCIGLEDETRSRSIWNRCLLGTLILIIGAGVATANLFQRFQSMIANSRELGRMTSLFARHPELDCVHFGKYIRQPAVFPSPDLLILMKAPPPSASRFMAAVAPRIRWRSSDNPLPAAAFIGVVADCPKVPPRTPAALATWREMYEPYVGEILFPTLLTELQIRSVEQMDFQFVPLQADDRLIYYFMYATRVRVFVVRPSSPPA